MFLCRRQHRFVRSCSEMFLRWGKSADPLGQRRDILVKRNTLGVPEPCPERRPARKEKRAYRATHQE